MKTNLLIFCYRIIFLLITFSTYSNLIVAQNWQTVSSTDSILYKVVAPTSTTWNNYLRLSRIDSSIIIPNGVKNYFYPSIRLDKFENIDTTNGGTWLGKFNIRLNNGDEYFQNQYEDSILIKTNANLNDSWTICSKNGISYLATITSLGQQIIDGNIDSTKHISIQAIQNSTPVANYYNNLYIILSKNHGFYECFELFGFPDKIIPTFDSFIVAYPFPYLPLMHQRIDNSIANLNINHIDFAFKFKPNNEWIYYFEYNTWKDWGYLHDSIISTQQLTPNSLQITRYRHTFLHFKKFPPQQPAYDTFYHTYSTFIDTVTQPSNNWPLKIIIPEHKYHALGADFDPQTYVHRFKWYYIDTFCTNKTILIDTTSFQTLLSQGSQISHRTIISFEETNLYQYENPGNNTAVWLYKEFIYLKLDSCIEGTKLNFKGLSTNDIDQREDLISLYPNPASTIIQIMNPANIELKSYTIKNITGEAIASGIYTNSVDISQLSNGLYFIEFKTKSGILTKKFIKN